MKLIESLNHIMNHQSSTSFKPRPTIDDWIAIDKRRTVEFCISNGKALINGRLVSVDSVKCNLTGYAGAAFFSLSGYGDTSGDAFTDALRQLVESGVPA